MRAKYLGRYEDRRYNEHFVYLEYEYRGHKYTVYENLNKGNEPLSWQHANAKAEIDKLIEMEEREKQNPHTTGPTVDEALAKFFAYVDGE